MSFSNEYHIFFSVHVNSAQNAKDSSSRGTLRKAKKKIFSHHLYLCMRDFGHRLGDDAEIYFYLYDGNPARMRALSERFMVRISKNFPKNCTVFTDLGK
jgi:dedicator of cytokinesis protein 3